MSKSKVRFALCSLVFVSLACDPAAETPAPPAATGGDAKPAAPAKGAKGVTPAAPPATKALN